MYKKFLNVQWFPNFNKGQTQKTPVTPIYGNGAPHTVILEYFNIKE